MTSTLTIADNRKIFFVRLHEEYDSFKNYIIRQPIDKVYDNSIKITFYREVFKYLDGDVLSDEEYFNFVGENILLKLWDIFVVAELPRQTRDYLRQLINLYKSNQKSKEGN